jgi:hypothetical protein
VRLAVAFEVFQTVFQLNAVVLEEGVDFHAGVEAKGTRAKLRLLGTCALV